MTWKSIDTAPSGTYREGATKKGMRTIFEPEWCFIHHGGKRYWTYKLESGRWNGLTDKQMPDLWHPAPELPHDNT